MLPILEALACRGKQKASDSCGWGCGFRIQWTTGLWESLSKGSIWRSCLYGGHKHSPVRLPSVWEWVIFRQSEDFFNFLFLLFCPFVMSPLLSWALGITNSTFVACLAATIPSRGAVLWWACAQQQTHELLLASCCFLRHVSSWALQP